MSEPSMNAEPASASEATLPARIGRYEIVRLLGRGSMGIVYEAKDSTLGRTVALKTIDVAVADAFGGYEEFEKRFFAEARIAARVSHPGIVVVHDVGKDPDNGTLFIVLEYLKGTTLAERLKARGAMPWNEVLPIVARVARAMDHAHHHGVVHRDLKPANIMILESGEAKVMDFGIAKAETSRMKVTSAGQFLGSPAYMSPEQALGHETDAKTDIFSLGTILTTLLVGRAYFAADNIPNILARIIREDPPMPSRLVGGVPEALDYVAGRAMAKIPEDRYPHAEMMADDLEDVLAGRSPRHGSAWSPAQADGTVVGNVAKVPEVDRDVEVAFAWMTGPPLEPTVHEEADDALDELAASLNAPTAPAVPRSVPRDSSAGAQPAPRPGTAPPPPPQPRVTIPPPDPRLIAGAPILLWAGAGFAVLIVVAALAVWLLRSTPAREADPTAAAPAVEASAAHEPATPAPSRRPPERTLPPVERGSAEAPVADEPHGAAAPNAAKARLHLRIEHPLKSGLLKVWIDEEIALERRLQARVAKKIIAIKIREAKFDEILDVEPGKHEIKVQIFWDDNERVEHTFASFEAGSRRELKVKLGQVKKDLKLEWE